MMYKKLVGGGVIKIMNNTVAPALMKRLLGYSPKLAESDREPHPIGQGRSKARRG